MAFCLAILASDVRSVTRCIFLVVRSVKRSHHDPRRQNTAPLRPYLSTRTLNVDWSVITMGNLACVKMVSSTVSISSGLKWVNVVQCLLMCYAFYSVILTLLP